jgi:hypothetical protein
MGHVTTDRGGWTGIIEVQLKESCSCFIFAQLFFSTYFHNTLVLLNAYALGFN